MNSKQSIENQDLIDIVGNSFEEMSISDMAKVQSSEDVDLEATPVAISGAISALGSAVVSAKNC
ncbi:type 2 lantibiotic, SP_1948 family [Mycobacteroides abscessus subsp. abscessus]|nr:type 2 lantibiotic, SP_1948 family [Mycobacteroides abscessus subsp. abscessus]